MGSAMNKFVIYRRPVLSILAITLCFLVVIACQAQPPLGLGKAVSPEETYHPPGLLLGPGLRLTIDGAENTGFGEAVAVSGDTLVIGGTDFNVGWGDQLGSVHVYQREAEGWALQARLQASDARDGFQFDPHFGASVAIAGDTIIVGAPGADHRQAGDNTGAVYIFQREGGSWVEVAKLEASQPTPHAWFGDRIALHGDTLAVAGNHNDGVYIFQRDGESWQEQARLEFQVSADTVWSRVSLALYGDTLAAGVTDSQLFGRQEATWNATRGDYWPNRGAVFVYQREAAGWTQIVRLDGEADFGFALALGASPQAPAGSADTLAIGSSGDNSAGVSAGAVYIYGRQGDSWRQQARLTAADAMLKTHLFAGTSVFFGSSLAMQGDLLLVSTRLSGSVYAFEGSMAVWTDQLKIKVGHGVDDWYGLPLSLDGNRILVGAPGEFGNSAFIYEFYSE
jgi:hypothetical protein